MVSITSSSRSPLHPFHQEVFFTDDIHADDMASSGDAGSIKARRQGDRLLVFVMNSGPKHEAVRLTTPRCIWNRARGYYGGTEYETLGETAVAIPHFDVAALLCNVEESRQTGGPTILLVEKQIATADEAY